ncbi:MAG: HEAT repeat domain-containing protein, partial [Vicinamibacterales bacterium]
MAEAVGLTASVRQKLDAGAAPEAVVQDLVAGGLSQASAERFVDRALAQRPIAPSWTPTPPTPPERPLDPDPSPSITDYLRAPEVVQEQQTRQAFKELTQGSLLMTGGILLTLVSLVFPAGGRIMIGLIAVGLWRFVRGVRHCARLDAQFPWKRVLIAIGIPLALGPGIVVALIVAGSVQRARKEAADAAAALAAADQSRADEIRAQSLAARESANFARTGRVDARLARAVEQLSSPQSTTRCDAALSLGRSGSPASVQPLLDVLADDGSGFVRNCAAGALVSLGETAAPLAAYRQ